MAKYSDFLERKIGVLGILRERDVWPLPSSQASAPFGSGSEALQTEVRDRVLDGFAPEEALGARYCPRRCCG